MYITDYQNFEQRDIEITLEGREMSDPSARGRYGSIRLHDERTIMGLIEMTHVKVGTVTIEIAQSTHTSALTLLLSFPGAAAAGTKRAIENVDTIAAVSTAGNQRAAESPFTNSEQDLLQLIKWGWHF